MSWLLQIESFLGARGRANKHEGTRRLHNEFMASWDGLRSKENQRILVLGPQIGHLISMMLSFAACLEENASNIFNCFYHIFISLTIVNENTNEMELISNFFVAFCLSRIFTLLQHIDLLAR